MYSSLDYCIASGTLGHPILLEQIMDEFHRLARQQALVGVRKRAYTLERESDGKILRASFVIALKPLCAKPALLNSYCPN